MPNYKHIVSNYPSMFHFLENYPLTIKQLGDIWYTINVELNPIEKLFLENINFKVRCYGMNALLSKYDIKGIDEIHKRLIRRLWANEPLYLHISNWK